MSKGLPFNLINFFIQPNLEEFLGKTLNLLTLLHKILQPWSYLCVFSFHFLCTIDQYIFENKDICSLCLGSDPNALVK